MPTFIQYLSVLCPCPETGHRLEGLTLTLFALIAVITTVEPSCKMDQNGAFRMAN